MKKNKTKVGYQPVAGAAKCSIQTGKKKKTFYIIKHKEPAND